MIRRPRRPPAASWSASSSSDLTPAEWTGDTVERHLAGLLVVGGCLEALMALLNAIALPSPARLVIPALQALLAAAAIATGVWARRRPPRHSQAQRLLAVGVMLIGLLLMLEMALTGNGLLAANLGLLLVGGGALLVSTRAYAVLVVVLVVAWALALTLRGAWVPAPANQAVLLVTALVFGVAVHVLRVSGHRALVSALARAVDSSLRDDLTGLWNRRGARAATRALVGGARKEGKSVWCLFLDVRGLKAVNDVLGHAEGDRLILAIGRTLAPFADSGAVPVRWGGDEFCLFGAGPAPDVRALAADLRRGTEQRIGPVDQPWDLSAGLAVSASPDHQDGLEDLVSRADEDMYHRRGLEVTRSSQPEGGRLRPG